MRKPLDPKPNRHSGALRRLGLRLKASGHVLLLAALCLGILAAAGQLNIALAVNRDGDLLGYVSSREELDSILSNVETSVSSALGEEWTPGELTTHLALAAMPADSDQVLAEKLLASVPELRELTVVYADGEAVCAFESNAEAAAALNALEDAYRGEGLESLRFRQEVVLGRALADVSLLTDAEEALARRLTVETVGTVVVEKVLPYAVKEIVDNQRFVEEGYVVTPGRDGLERVETLVRYENGVAAGMEGLSRTRQEPVTELVVTGTRVHRTSGGYIWPVEEGWLSSPFGLRSGFGSSYHHGVDIANDLGTPILAADGGVVFFAEDDGGGYGLLVKIQHDNGDVTYYAHCSKLYVQEGDVVSQGDVIAEIGSTGQASGNHCHFELHPGGGEAADPMKYLPACPYPRLP